MLEVYENEVALTKVIFGMNRRGILLDREYTKKALAYEEGLIKKARAEFEIDTGHPYKESSKLFAEIFDSRGEPYPLTDKGNPSFKADFLEGLDTHTARLINQVRKHEKRASTYYRPFLHFGRTGIIHPNLNQAGTTTGRFSASNPNLQNPPKEDLPEDEGKPYYIRSCFVPRPGYCFVSVDYSAVEFLVMLDYAGETSVIREVLSGGDVHQVTADMLGVSRKVAKTLGFGLLYGLGIDNFAKALGVEVREARALRALYFRRLPAVKKFTDKVKYVAERRGYITNWMGRRLYLPDKRFSYKMLNHLIQGGAADVIKKAMVQIQPLFANRKSGMLLNIHDELVFEMQPDEFDLLEPATKIMESVYRPLNGMKLITSTDHSWENLGYWSQKKGRPDAVRKCI
jgi:DNA polymerase I